ncbi:hypothetical protein, partial [Peptoniphilus duerdenii]|uniref:hypothetical protein n=1 Tax=Peptoniphilus duerdenii TaxID=507750 RepID=UPI0023F42DB7
FEYDRNWYLYYGLRLQIKDINTESNSYELLKKKLISNDYKFSDWWLGWKSIKADEKDINFTDMDPDLVYILMDEDKLNDLIKKITKEVKDFIHIIVD